VTTSIDKGGIDLFSFRAKPARVKRGTILWFPSSLRIR
jgi:hypothetical protein